MPLCPHLEQRLPLSVHRNEQKGQAWNSTLHQPWRRHWCTSSEHEEVPFSMTSDYISNVQGSFLLTLFIVIRQVQPHLGFPPNHWSHRCQSSTCSPDYSVGLHACLSNLLRDLTTCMSHSACPSSSQILRLSQWHVTVSTAQARNPAGIVDSSGP